MSTEIDNYIHNTIHSIIEHEGGYSDHAADLGGKTRYGITQKTARDNGYDGKMQEFPLESAHSIYMQAYVKPFIPIIDHDIKQESTLAFTLIHFGVNAGVGRASKVLQNSLNRFTKNNKVSLVADGVAGKNTWIRLNSFAKSKQWVRMPALNAYVRYLITDHYVKLVNRKTEQQVFELGWLKRQYQIQQQPFSDLIEQKKYF